MNPSIPFNPVLVALMLAFGAQPALAVERPSMVEGAKCVTTKQFERSPSGEPVDTVCTLSIDVDEDGRQEEVTFTREAVTLCTVSVDEDEDGVMEELSLPCDGEKFLVVVTIKDIQRKTKHRYQQSTVHEGIEYEDVVFGLLKGMPAGAPRLMIAFDDIAPGADFGSARTTYLSYSSTAGVQAAITASAFVADGWRNDSEVSFRPDGSVDLRQIKGAASNRKEVTQRWCMSAGVYALCPLAVGSTLFVQASVANVRPAVGSRAKVTSLPIQTPVKVERIEDEWLFIQALGYKGWVYRSLLGPTEPDFNQLIATYRAIKPCSKPGKGSGCDAKKLKARRKWAERATAIRPKDKLAVGLLVESLEQLLAAKVRGVFASKKARRATRRELAVARAGLDALEPIYFRNGTFDDHGEDVSEEFVASRLSCRKQLIRQFIKPAKRPPVHSNGSSTEWSRQVSPSELKPLLERRCAEFKPDRPLWSLVPNPASNTATWNLEAVQVGLKIRSYVQTNCEDTVLEPPNAVLSLSFKSLRQIKPSLFASAPQSPSMRAVDHYSVTNFTTEPVPGARVPSSFPGAKPDQIGRKQLVGSVRRLGIRAVYAQTLTGEMEMGYGPRQRLLQQIKVVVVWSSGQELVLYQEHGNPKDGYRSPEGPSQLIVTDLDGDGQPEFLIASRAGLAIVDTVDQALHKKWFIVKAPEGYENGC